MNACIENFFLRFETQFDRKIVMNNNKKKVSYLARLNDDDDDDDLPSESFFLVFISYSCLNGSWLLVFGRSVGWLGNRKWQKHPKCNDKLIFWSRIPIIFHFCHVFFWLDLQTNHANVFSSFFQQQKIMLMFYRDDR